MIESKEDDKDVMKRVQKRVDAGDSRAMSNLGNHYFELWHRAAELGYSPAYFSIGVAYQDGRGVKMDEKMADHYYELAAIGGSVLARHNLAVIEENSGNMNRLSQGYVI